jgi:hypothetical protein
MADSCSEIATAGAWIIDLPKSYKSHLYRPQRILRKFLREKHILNGSDYQPSGEEIEIMALDSAFVCDRTDAGATLDDCVSDYVRKVNTALFFGWRDTNSRTQTGSKSTHGRGLISHLLTKSKNKSVSGWNPPRPKPDWATDTECARLINDLKYALTKNKKRLRHSGANGRLPSVLWSAVTSLRMNPSFYICQADKGGVTVLWSRVAYEKEALRQLCDPENYKEMVSLEPNVGKNHSVLRHLQDLKKMRVEWMHFMKLITDKERNMMLECPDTSERIPHIFFSTKIHKKIRHDTQSWEGRPIVATFNGPLHWIDKYLSELTKSLQPKIPCSLMGTVDFLNKLDNYEPVPDGMKLFSADARSLFTCIPWEDGASAAVEIYHHHLPELVLVAKGNQMPKPPTPTVFRILLMTILENSYVQFQDGRVFHQIRGTAMGACISVFLARCYMYKACAAPLLLNPPAHLRMLHIFVDDLFFGTMANGNEEIDALIDRITVTSHLSFERSTLSEECNFLDVTVKVSHGRLITKSFTKPNCNPCLLHYGSVHPEAVLKGLVRGEFVRLRRNCTQIVDFMEFATRLKRKLKTRGYPAKLIEHAYELALRRPRSQCLTQDRQFKKAKFANKFSTPIRLIAPYGKGRDWNKARIILRRLDARFTKLYGRKNRNKFRSTLVFTQQKPIGSAWTSGSKFGK